MPRPPLRPASLYAFLLLATVATALDLHLPKHYHAPIPLINMLALSPFSPLSASFKQRSGGGGLTYDSCSSKSKCAAGRSCLDPSANFIACTDKTPCVCLPQVPPLCFLSSDCDTAGEICADVPIAETPLCVSSVAAGMVPELIPIKVAPGGGRTLDTCDKDSECSGGRQCTIFGDDFKECNGARNCACHPKEALFCVDSTECPQGEICALTPFTKKPICASLKAANAYTGVTKVPDANSCPVRISRDPPVKSLGSSGASTVARNVAHNVKPKTVRRWMKRAAEVRMTSLGRFGMSDEKGFDMDRVARIVGGQFASKHLRRYMVAIYKSNFTSLCSGTLLSPRWVLTAAHCKVEPTATVALGATRAFGDGTLFAVTRVFSHPKYAPTAEGRQFDMAVLEIDGGALNRSKFMELNDDPTVPRPGSFVRDIGFGDNSFERKLPDNNPRTLKQVDVPVATFKTCMDAYKKAGEVVTISQERQLCAGYPQGNCGSCQGDSGGPVIQYNKMQMPIVLGVVAFGVRCALPGFPTVYTRVSALIPWLKTTPAVFYTSKGVNGNGQCKPGEFLFSFTKNVKFCRQCLPNQISRGGPNAKCITCPRGLSRSKADATKCACVGGGKGIIDGICRKCPPGKFSLATESVCRPCPPGSVAPNVGSGSCKKCPEKFFADKAGSTECTK